MGSVDLVHGSTNNNKTCTALDALQITYSPPGKIIEPIRVFRVS